MESDGFKLRRTRKMNILLVFIALSFCGNGSSLPTSNGELKEMLVDLTSKVDELSDEEGALTAIDTKLDRMEQKLDILTGENTVTTGNSEVNRQSTIAPGTSPESAGETDSSAAVPGTGQSSADYPYDLCVNLISVERNPTDEGNRYTIRFTKNAEEIFYRYHDDLGPEKAPDSVVEEEGVWAISFTCGNTTLLQTSPWFTIGDIVQEGEENLSFLNTRHMIHLQLDNSELTAASQVLSTIPPLHVIPVREAVYVPGHDINVTGFVPKSEENSDPVDYIYSSFDGIDLKTGRLHMNLVSEHLLKDLPLDEEDPSRVESRITVLTSNNTVSGYLLFGAALKQHPEGAVVKNLQISRAIDLRPSNQSGILPPGYLGIYDFDHRETSENGNELNRCGVGYECWQHCFAVGETISSLAVKQLLPDGSEVDVPSAINPIHATQMDTFLTVYWQFQAEEDSGESDGITTFQCKATDATHGNVVTKRVDVLSMIEASLDHERSSVEIHADPMNAAVINITFNCAVKGRPLPEATFYSPYSSTDAFQLYNEPPDSVVTTGSSEAIAKKVVTLDLDYLTSYGYQINGVEGEEGPFCEIYVPTLGEHVRYSFEMPHIPLE